MEGVKVHIVEIGHHDLLRPIARELSARGYRISWEPPRLSERLGRADIVWLSALALGGESGREIVRFTKASGDWGWKLVSYYVGDWTNLAAGRDILRAVNWKGFDLCFHANPALLAELHALRPVTRGVNFVYLPRAINPDYRYKERKKFGRRIGMWGQYARWWKEPWWLIRAFGKLQDMTNERWELELWGGKLKFAAEIPDLARSEAEASGAKLLGWSSWDELVEWVYGLDIVACASISEGDAKPIAEGMLTGCYPLVRNWPGARDMYPEKYIVENEWDFVQKAMAWGDGSDGEKAQLSREAAEFAAEKHDLKAIVDTVDWEFRKLVGR